MSATPLGHCHITSRQARAVVWRVDSIEPKFSAIFMTLHSINHLLPTPPRTIDHHPQPHFFIPASVLHLHFIVCTPNTPTRYFLPQIHKPNDPGHPIVSARNCTTILISKYFDRVLVVIVASLPSHINNTNHALHRFKSFTSPSHSSQPFLYHGQEDLIHCYPIQWRP